MSSYPTLIGQSSSVKTSGGSQDNPQRELCEFLTSLDNYTPTVPDAVTKYYLQKIGVSVDDPRVAKLVSLAADKFLAETIHETRQNALLRSHSIKSGKRKLEAGDVLEQEDLEIALAEQGIRLKRKRDGQKQREQTA